MKALKYIALVLVLLGGAAAAYYYLYPTPELRALNIIPRDAVFIVESADPVGSWKTIRKSSIWRHVSGNKLLADITAQTDYLDSLIKNNDMLFSALGSRRLTFSVHKTEARNFDMLYVVDLQNESKLKLFQGGFKPLLRSLGQNVTTQDFQGESIMVIRDPQTKDELYMVLMDNLLLTSYTLKLVQEAVKQKAESFLQTHPSFIKIRKMVNDAEMFNLYIQFAYFDDFVRIYSDQYNDLLKTIPQTMDFAGLELRLSEDEFELNGKLLLNDSSQSYLHALLEVGKGESVVTKVLPQRTAFYTGIRFDDYASVFQKYQEILKQNEMEYKEFRENIDFVEKKLKISFEKDFLSWIGQEIAVAQIKPQRSDLKTENVLVFHVNDPALAKEKLTHITKQIKKKSVGAVKFENLNYKDYEISKLEFGGFFKLLFGKLLKKYDDYKPYFIYVGEYVVFSNNFHTLEELVDDYDNGRTLFAYEPYTKFAYNFDGSANIFCYAQSENLFDLMGEHLSAESWKDMQKNETYFKSFRHTGLSFSGETDHYELKLLTVHDSSWVDVDDTDSSDVDNETQTGDSLAAKETEVVNGEFETRYPNGGTKARGTMKDGKMDGDYKAYWKSGNLKESGQYENGERKGKWYFYNRDGKLKRKEEY